jgi:hypothetical protein
MSDNQTTSPEPGAETSEKAPSFIQVVASVLAAALGVQSARNRQRDFEHGNPLVFIAAGLIFTILFIATIVGVVHLVL